MDPKDKVLQLVRMRGPVIPSNIHKEIGMDLMMTSAILSEMVEKGMLRISSVKIGGSPLYYAPGQEHRLQEYSNKLHEKDKRVYDLLNSKGILRDKALDPLTRVALRQIKDFAKPLEVTIGEDREIFWKWYLLPTDQTEPLIRTALGFAEEKKPEPVPEPAPAVQAQKPAQQTKLPQKPIMPTEQVLLQKAAVAERKQEKQKAEDSFVKRIMDYFRKNSIIIEEQKAIRKAEIDFIIKVPSAVGELRYYCKAKNKKRSNDADLSAAYVQGQLRKLPVLFLTTGELAKAAKGMLEREFAGITIKKV